MAYGKQSGRLRLMLSWLSLPQCSEQCEQNNEIKKVIISLIIAHHTVQYPSMRKQKKMLECSSKEALKVDQRTQNKTESLYGSTHKPFNTVKFYCGLLCGLTSCPSTPTIKALCHSQLFQKRSRCHLRTVTIIYEQKGGKGWRESCCAICLAHKCTLINHSGSWIPESECGWGGGFTCKHLNA